MSAALINDLVAASYGRVDPALRDWVNTHVMEPKPHTAWDGHDRKKQISLWLVTEHTGYNDTSYRIVYDPATEHFGLELLLADGTSIYQGPTSEDFAATVAAM